VNILGEDRKLEAVAVALEFISRRAQDIEGDYEADDEIARAALSALSQLDAVRQRTDEQTIDTRVIGWYTSDVLDSMFKLDGGQLLRVNGLTRYGFDPERAKAVEPERMKDGFERIMVETIKRDLEGRGY
jgi:hypothetical protein